MPHPYEDGDNESDRELQARIDAADKLEAELQAAGIPQSRSAGRMSWSCTSRSRTLVVRAGRMTSPRRPPRSRCP